MRNTPRRSTISPPAPEPVRQLPSALRRAQGRHRSQRQAPAGLPALGHAVRVVPGNRPECESYLRPGVTLAELEQFAQSNPTPKPRWPCNAPNVNCCAHRQTQRLNCTRRQRSRSAVEMTGCGQPWKTAIAHAMGAPRRFPTAAHRPWKTLRVSHIPTAPTTLLSLSQNKTKGPGSAGSQPYVQAHPSMRKCSPKGIRKLPAETSTKFDYFGTPSIATPEKYGRHRAAVGFQPRSFRPSCRFTFAPAGFSPLVVTN